MGGSGPFCAKVTRGNSDCDVTTGGSSRAACPSPVFPVCRFASTLAPHRGTYALGKRVRLLCLII